MNFELFPISVKFLPIQLHNLYAHSNNKQDIEDGHDEKTKFDI